MRDRFDEYREQMDQIRLTDSGKRALLDSLRQQTRGPVRRSPRLLRTALIAAAVIVLAVALMGAGNKIIYHFTGPGGTQIYAEKGYAKIDSMEQIELVTLEEGRLWLTVFDERTDITDLVDEDTPYIYTFYDEDTDTHGIIIAGGTPEDFGWAEMYFNAKVGGGGGGSNYVHTYAQMDGELLERENMAPEEWNKAWDDGLVITVYKSWYLNAIGGEEANPYESLFGSHFCGADAETE